MKEPVRMLCTCNCENARRIRASQVARVSLFRRCDTAFLSMPWALRTFSSASIDWSSLERCQARQISSEGHLHLECFQLGQNLISNGFSVIAQELKDGAEKLGEVPGQINHTFVITLYALVKSR